MNEKLSVHTRRDILRLLTVTPFFLPSYAQAEEDDSSPLERLEEALEFLDLAELRLPELHSINMLRITPEENRAFLEYDVTKRYGIEFPFADSYVDLRQIAPHLVLVIRELEGHRFAYHDAALHRNIALHVCETLYNRSFTNGVFLRMYKNPTLEALDLEIPALVAERWNGTDWWEDYRIASGRYTVLYMGPETKAFGMLQRQDERAPHTTDLYKVLDVFSSHRELTEEEELRGVSVQMLFHRWKVEPLGGEERTLGTTLVKRTLDRMDYLEGFAPHPALLNKPPPLPKE